MLGLCGPPRNRTPATIRPVALRHTLLQRQRQELLHRIRSVLLPCPEQSSSDSPRSQRTSLIYLWTVRLTPDFLPILARCFSSPRRARDLEFWTLEPVKGQPLTRGLESLASRIPDLYVALKSRRPHELEMTGSTCFEHNKLCRNPTPAHPEILAVKA